MSAVSSTRARLSNPVLSAFMRRSANSLVILLVIAYLTLFGLILAERGKAGLPAQPLDAGFEALRRTIDYVVKHPLTYRWHRQDVVALGLALTLFARSAALLLLSLAIAALAGVPLGMAAALSRRRKAASLVLLVSVIGISTPSFLLAMLFWVINVQAYRNLGLPPLPPTGFGWDAHIILPALVLAARPFAQIVQITYVSLSSIMGEDYVRTAHAKGLGPWTVVNRHAMRNILIPVLTTLALSLRFSLASLPVVEAFFNWPGAGLGLLQAIELGLAPLAADLLVALCLLFLMINLGLDAAYVVIDPRLRAGARGEAQTEERHTWRERWADLRSQLPSLPSLISKLRARFSPIQSRMRSGRVPRPQTSTADVRPQPATGYPAPGMQLDGGESPLLAGRRSFGWMLRSTLGNLPLLFGILLALALLGLAVWGEQLASASPYETHGVMSIAGKVGAPPFPPSPVFPWGSDGVGRDIQALVLAGAKQTLTLAFLAMLARMALGATLGVLAGWWRGSWLDRLVTGSIAVWAAFPVTLFAMIVILALGITQGMGVFVIALCVVGWGEIAQFVRGQVTSLRSQPFVEAAQAVGARTGRILTWHALPHLWAPLLVLAMLEMGSVLMLLAELGFLNIFLGGGFKAEIGEAGKMVPVIYNFSDVPEWGALLANIRNWWRSYPWLAWYAGLAFFFAILTFNLLGEGLRRFLEDTRIDLGRLINRYALVVLALGMLGGGWLARTTAPIEAYADQAQQFDVERAMGHLRTLASVEFRGRESGMPGADLAARYIAGQMEETGLFPAGEKNTFFYTMTSPRAHVAEVPRLEILSDNTGEVSEAFAYRQDFVEQPEYYASESLEGEGAVVGLAAGPELAEGALIGLRKLDLRDRIIIVRKADFERLSGEGAGLAGVLLVDDDPDTLRRRQLYPGPNYGVYYYFKLPMMNVTSQVADRLLATAGSSLAELDALAGKLPPGELATTGLGARLRVAIPMEPERSDEKVSYVIGYIPGTGGQMGEKEKGKRFGDNAVKGLDSNVIIVSAYYDGMGTGPDGTLYAGANDNASGVAVMLEMARVLKESPRQTRKTIVFVAWSSAERREGLSVAYVMNAKLGFNLLTVESIIELSGVGAGSGTGIALGEGTSFSLVQLFQDAAGRVGVPITTRGRGPHFGIETRSGFGGRSALTARVSWNGSDATAHTAADTLEAIDPAKLTSVGQATLLVVSVLGQAEAQESAFKPLMPPSHYVQGARMFDEERALKHIETLADDELEGRRPGTPGGQAAGDYIAARFAEYGLRPAGPDGSYFQPFTALYTTVVESPLLAVASPGTSGQAAFTRTYTYHVDYMPRSGALGSGEAQGRVVWVNGCVPGASAGQDLAGKVVLCERNILEEPRDVITRALQSGVSGMLVVVPGLKSPIYRPTYGGGELAPIPTFYITEEIARDVLTGSGYTLQKLGLEYTPIPLAATVHMAARIEPREITARNVLGLLPGTDPQHKDEVVILGAYYDHLGRDPDGTIYNGAYVNASGVAAMLEIARLWQAQGYRPARSVLFVGWDHSEQGWLGARHYVQNPIRPLDHTVALLNLEMTGRGRDVTIVGRGTVADQLEVSAGVYSATVQFMPSVEWGDSLAFHEGAVPTGALMCFESSMQGSVYHRPEDDVENIEPDSLRAAGVLAAHSLAAWSGGGPTQPMPASGPARTVRDLILPTPTCIAPWPVGSMTCDHGQWAR